MNGDQNPLVKQQYERYPYPARDPQDERTRLIGTWLDDLRMVNHHCFRGEESFEGGFRALVAGGGTGDGTIFLAEQLRPLGGEVVHLDISRQAIAIARERARIRGLDNVRFVEASLVELPRLGLGTFRYINCCGVLHHLPEPERGLDALMDVLASDGALGILVYARYGRTGVYQLQALLRLLCGDENDESKIAVARQTLASLPRTNWFIRGEELHSDHRLGGDAGLFDLLLHPQDRAYAVPELYEMFTDRRGLAIQWSDWHRGRLPYQPETHLVRATPQLLDRARALGPRERCAAAELVSGAIITHSFYATPGTVRVARYWDAKAIPMVVNDRATGRDIAAVIESYRDQPFLLRHAQSGLERAMDPKRFVRHIFQELDGTSSFGAIFERVRRRLPGAHATDDELFSEFEPWYQALETIDRLLLRQPAGYAGLTNYSISAAMG